MHVGTPARTSGSVGVVGEKPPRPALYASDIKRLAPPITQTLGRAESVDRIVGLSGALATNPLKLKDLPAQLGGKPTVEHGRKRAADRLWSVYSGPIPQAFRNLHSESRRKP